MRRLTLAVASIVAASVVGLGQQRGAPPAGAQGHGFAIALLQAAVGGGTIQGTVANMVNEPIFTARVELTGGAL